MKNRSQYEYDSEKEYIKIDLDDDIDIDEDNTDENNPNKKSVEQRRRIRTKKRKRRFKLPIGKIVGVMFALFVLVYISMLVYSSNFTMIETEEAEQYEVNDCIEVRAYAVRNEEYVENQKDGILAYVVSDGENVNVGGTVAKLFATETDVNSWQEYNRINSELTLLQQMSNAENNMFVDLDTVDAQVRKEIVSFKTSLQGNRFDDVRQTRLDLLQLFNERTVITNSSANFQTRIAQLQSDLDAISVSDSIGDVKSKVSGVFASTVDGFEKSVDYASVSSLMPGDLDNLIEKSPPSNAVGKVITTLNWYLVCPVTAEQALTVTTGEDEVEISIPKVISGTIPGTVVSVNQASKTEDGLLIIKCDYMDDDLASIRQEDISIKTKTYSGLKISRKAIHEDFITVQDYDENGNPVGDPYEKKVQGVYVMYGRRLSFVQVNIIYSGKEYVICDPDVTSSALYNGETVALHDEVVVQGKELYNGKIIK